MNDGCCSQNPFRKRRRNIRFVDRNKQKNEKINTMEMGELNQDAIATFVVMRE